VLRKTATKIASTQAQNNADEQPPADEDGSTAPAVAEIPSAEAGSPAAQAKTSPAESNGKVPSADKKKPAKKTKAAKVATVKIGLDAVRDALGRQKFFQESAARTATPGVATGLAVTGAGGDVLFVEATTMKGSGSGGNSLVLTGQLGDVMKESAKIALSYVRGHAEEFGIEESAFENHEFHVHVPAGAIPKDGPSAGVTMVTALASLLSGRPVKHTVGMTGEVTLQGRVLPIGGFKQKALAANAAGLTDVILPERNRGDLDEIPEEVRNQMTFHPVMTVREVLNIALEPARDVSRLP
jgi:ATP-dependent Lon protease